MCACVREREKEKNMLSKYTKRWKTVPVCHTDVTEVRTGPVELAVALTAAMLRCSLLMVFGVSEQTLGCLRSERGFKASSHPLYRNPRRHQNILNVAMATKHILHRPTVNCTFALVYYSI